MRTMSIKLDNFNILNCIYCMRGNNYTCDFSLHVLTLQGMCSWLSQLERAPVLLPTTTVNIHLAAWMENTLNVYSTVCSNHLFH